jgi:hypothetical protein
LGNTTPTGAHPASFDFSSSGLGIGFSSLNPLLRQSFFIGDGLTGTGSGTHQTFYVPTGATRLFLGVLDGTQINAAPGSAYFNNTGSFSVTYDLVVASVPEPETYAMLLAGLGLIGAAVKRRKAKQA